MNFFRRHLESRITKAIAIFFAIIFVGWEFATSMLRQPNNWVIKVGEIEYMPQDWQENYKHFTQDPLSAQEAMLNPKYAKQRVLDEMIRNAVILQEATSVGLQVNDKMAASEIIHMKMFQNEDKKFDKSKLENLLKNNNMSEGEFIKKMKDNILKNQLMDIFYNTSGIIGIPTFNLLLKLVTAEQNITLYKTPFVYEVTPPSDVDLKQFMDINNDRFITEDKAEISKIVFTEDLIKIEKITEEEIKDYYATHTVVEPEKRIVNQIVISSYNEAKQVLENIRSGKITYDEVAKSYKQQQMIPYEIGPFVAEEFDEDISKAVFSLSLNEVSDLIQTPLGWHMFRVNNIYEAKEKDLNLMRDDIVQTLTKQKFTDQMNKLVEQVMGEISSQLSMSDIASKYNLNIIKTSEKSNKLSNGMIDTFAIPDDFLEDGVSKKKILAAVFMNDNQIKLLPAKDNRSFIILQTDSFTPGHLMSFEDAKARLIVEYKLYNADHKAKEYAKAQRTSLLEKKDMDKIAGQKLRISRIRSNDKVPDCIKQLIADMNRNGIFDGFTVPCMQDKNYFFAELQAIDFSVEVSDEDKASLREPILSIYNEMIFNQFLTQLRQKYKVELDERFIKYLNEK